MLGYTNETYINATHPEDPTCSHNISRHLPCQYTHECNLPHPLPTDVSQSYIRPDLATLEPNGFSPLSNSDPYVRKHTHLELATQRLSNRIVTYRP